MRLALGPSRVARSRLCGVFGGCWGAGSALTALQRFFLGFSYPCPCRRNQRRVSRCP